MNKELILKKLNRLRQLLEEDKDMCEKMKAKTDDELEKFGTNLPDLQHRIQSHSIEIRELEDLINSIETSQ